MNTPVRVRKQLALKRFIKRVTKARFVLIFIMKDQLKTKVGHTLRARHR